MRKFYSKYRNNKLFIVALIILFWPYGLYLAWKNRLWSTKTRTILATILIILTSLIGVGAYNAPPTVALSDAALMSDYKTDESSILIAGTVSSIRESWVTINGSTVRVEEYGKFQHRVALKEGAGIVTIAATSKKGTETTELKIYRTTAGEIKERKRVAEQQEADRLAAITTDEEKAAKAAELAETTRQIKLASAQDSERQGNLYKVVSIIDGDTIKVSINGKTETIRFIGMDTPETKDPRKPIQCFGKEATSKMQSFAQSKMVRLQADSSQGDRDKYKRLLRYVFLEDGRNVAYEMIKEGYAHEYTYSLPYKYQAQFKAAYAQAREANLGLWSANTCGGNTNQQKEAPAPKPVPAAAAPAQQAAPPQQSAPAQQPEPNSVYYKNCTAARAAGAAPVYAGQPGYGTHLDRDRDGIGCE